VYADAGKGVAHFIELEGLYDGDDELHGLLPPGAPSGAVLDLPMALAFGGVVCVKAGSSGGRLVLVA
jgi:hypothetical protein